MQASAEPDELADVRRALAQPSTVIEDASLARAAVALMVSPGRQVWFIRRAERFGDPWSGHLGFPGGREQSTDHDLYSCAVRETWEEIGVDLRGAELLGHLHDLRVRPVRTMMVRCYVFALGHAPLARPNDEVQSVHAFGLDDLLTGVGRGSMTWPPLVGITLPRVDFDGLRLWGLTLQLVDDLLDRLDGRGTGLARG